MSQNPLPSAITQPTILVIVGISGDLARRKVLPAIRQIAKAGILPQQFRIVGITRRQLSMQDIVPDDDVFMRKMLQLYQMDLTEVNAYTALNQYLQAIEAEYGTSAQRLFYISLPPQAARPTVEFLGRANFGKHSNTRLLLEKPFGTDGESALEMVEDIRQYFTEDQVYRIDHYLAKEMAQNLLVFRSQNTLFSRSWNKDFIESVTITASEDIGIEGRTDFYEQTGALRDVVQSHLLQLAALTLMDVPADEDWVAVPARRLQALQHISSVQNIPEQALRAQYAGYRQEAGNPDSMVETFVRLTLYSSAPQWRGVPITLTTGKALNSKTTEIRLQYRHQHADQINQLVLHIQPNEGVELDVWAKQPGYDHQLKKVPLSFLYSNHFNDLPEAYERVFVDAMRGDHSLFTTSDEVLESWRILQPVQHYWGMNSQGLAFYQPGSDPQSIS